MRPAARRKKLAQVIERDGHACWICGHLVIAGHETLDHVQRVADGGSNTIDNLRLAHPRCNRRRDRAHRKAQRASATPSR